MVSLNCFVAMAFGHEDTDIVYKTCIEVVSKELNIIPLRIDKKNHNDRIDQRILQEILKTDFMIADLTYARPSVYYEAGFGERGLAKKVIYTCRDDHLSNPNSDYKVHFDLQNANIIKWKSESLQEFANDLKDRINLVTKDIRDKKEKEESLRIASKNFSQLSLKDQWDQITTQTQSLLGLYGFKNSKLFDPNLFHKNMRADHIFVTVCKCRNWLQKDLEILNSRFFQRDFIIKPKTKFMKYLGFEISSDIKSIRNIYLIPSIVTIPQARLDKAFYNFAKDKDRIHFYFNIKKPKINSKNPELYPTSYEYVVLQDLKSLLHLEYWFKNNFPTIFEDNSCICFPPENLE
jgi:hypothetical protein